MRAIEFTAMGSTCRVVVGGGPASLADDAVALIHTLESQWSRFLEHSEVSELNRLAGAPCLVSDETFELVRRAADAVELTDGRFNPLLLRQLEAAGYCADHVDADPDALGRAGSVERIECWTGCNLVRLPAGTAFDPGGIGKGLAVDLVTEMLLAAGASTTSVELGGDVRVEGDSWTDTGWVIDIGNPFDRAGCIATMAPTHGAVATSSVLQRRWVADGEARHHLIDPVSGRPANTDLVAVTTCSTQTWWAEVASKVALIAGSLVAPHLLQRCSTPALLVHRDGNVTTVDPRAQQVMA